MITKRSQPLNSKLKYFILSQSIMLDQTRKVSYIQPSPRNISTITLPRKLPEKIDRSDLRKILNTMISVYSSGNRNKLCQLIWKVTLEGDLHSEVRNNVVYVGKQALISVLEILADVLNQSSGEDLQINEIVRTFRKLKQFKNADHVELVKLAALFADLQKNRTEQNSLSKKTLSKFHSNFKQISLENTCRNTTVLKYNALLSKTRIRTEEQLCYSIRVKINEIQEYLNIFEGDSEETVVRRFFKSKKIPNDYELRVELEEMVREIFSKEKGK